MVNSKQDIVKALRSCGLEVYYENFLNSESEIPCISYAEYDNSANAQGDTLGYSNIVYKIKIWGRDLSTFDKYSALVDNIMREQGFTRTNMNELWLDGIGQKEMKYSALALENF